MTRGPRLDAEGALHYITQSVLGGMEWGGEDFQKRGWSIKDFTEKRKYRSYVPSVLQEKSEGGLTWANSRIR
jgi:hypothetical protein